MILLIKHFNNFIIIFFPHYKYTRMTLIHSCNLKIGCVSEFLIKWNITNKKILNSTFYRILWNILLFFLYNINTQLRVGGFSCFYLWISKLMLQIVQVIQKFYFIITFIYVRSLKLMYFNRVPITLFVKNI